MVLIDCRMFVRIVRIVFEKIQKKSKNDCFLSIFGLILAMFPTSQSHDFDAIVPIGLSNDVE